MSELSTLLVNAVQARNPTISADDLGHVRAFGRELDEAARPAPDQQPNAISRDEGRQLAASRHLVGAGARHALNHVLDVLAPKSGVAQPGALTLAPEARALLDVQRARVAHRDFLEWSGFAGAARWLNTARGVL